jgi:hypothetical protein
MIPNQLIVVDLERRKCEVDLIIETTASNSLKNLSVALILRVDGRTTSGITVSEGPQCSVELHLEGQQLRFGDVVVLYRPWVRELTPEVLSPTYGPNALVFRVPADARHSGRMSQVSQHRANLRRDGLLFRNSAACWSARGTAERIEHATDATATEIGLCDASGHAVRVLVLIADCACEVQKVLVVVCRSHFLWMFGLVEQGPHAHALDCRIRESGPPGLGLPPQI